MNKLLIILLIVQAVIIVNSKEFRSKKLAREGTQTRQSNVKYIKTNDLHASLLEQPHEFYESEFATRIDHFRPLNQQTVNFTYNVNTFNFENYGPLFIYIKDAFDYTTQRIEDGLMVDIAEEAGAALLIFNHRYFGENRPADSASYENLELLSTEQMLADIAVFIRAARQAIPTAQFSRVILWGSAVGGTLAAMARARYPHLVYAAWSSSGIIESAPYSWGPYDIFAYTFDIGDTGRCRDLIADAFEEIGALVIAGQGEQLSDQFNLCNLFQTDSSADVALFYERRLRMVMEYIHDFHYEGVLDFCEDMGAVEGDPLESFARWISYVYGGESGECSNNGYDWYIGRYLNYTWDQIGTQTGRRQWLFLQCTQVGSFLVADQYTWLPATIDINFHLQKCEDLFGVPFTYATLTEAFYTLRDEFTQAISRVVYTNGNIDPLRYYGRLYDASGSAVVINIDFASKSADLTSISDDEPESFTAAKEAIINLVTRWATEQPPTEPPVTGI